jgi:hypothetical protein
MRPLFALALLIATPFLRAQTVDWPSVDVNLHHLDPQLAPAKLSPHQQANVRTLILRTVGYTCIREHPLTFTYSIAPIGRGGIVYVSPDGGCLRGGQETNASLWLIDTSAPRPRIIASPKENFEGWGLGIQPHTSHGLHDIVTAWHMSADDTLLAYFRFDGTHYRRLSDTHLLDCQTFKGHEHDSGSCFQNGQHALDSGTY